MTATPTETTGSTPSDDGLAARARDRPGSIDELRARVGEHAGAGRALYPQGGGTALDYGGPPARPGVALDLTALDRVVDYPAADMTITIEAGATLARLRALLAAEGQFLPLDAPHPDRATLGGIFACDEAGPRRFGWGRPRDLIIGVGFVDARGDLIRGGGRVVKNVAGYDFPRLLTGSMGTLGVIAELTLKVRPRPEALAFARAGFDRLDEADAALARLNTSRTRPVIVELLNRTAASRLAGEAGPPSGEWVVVVGFEDNAASVRWQLEAVAGELAPGRLDVVEGDAAARLGAALAGHADAAEATLGLVATARPSAVAALAGRLDPARWAVQAHAGSGVVRAHLVGVPMAEPEAAEVVRALRGEAVAAGGNLILARCPTPWKAALGVWGEPRGDWPVMERIKRAFDPAGVMNPGRFVGTI